MILTFTPEVDLVVDKSNSSVANVALSEIRTNLKINYEIWIDKNDTRIKSITPVVPSQTLTFKNEVNDVWYNVIVVLTEIDSEVDSTQLVEGAEPYELEICVEEFAVLEEEQTIQIKATGVLYFDE